MLGNDNALFRCARAHTMSWHVLGNDDAPDAISFDEANIVEIPCFTGCKFERTVACPLPVCAIPLPVADHMRDLSHCHFLWVRYHFLWVNIQRFVALPFPVGAIPLPVGEHVRDLSHCHFLWVRCHFLWVCYHFLWL